MVHNCFFQNLIRFSHLGKEPNSHHIPAFFCREHYRQPLAGFHIIQEADVKPILDLTEEALEALVTRWTAESGVRCEVGARSLCVGKSRPTQSDGYDSVLDSIGIMTVIISEDHYQHQYYQVLLFFDVIAS